MTRQNHTRHWRGWPLCALLFEACSPAGNTPEDRGLGGSNQAYFGPDLQIGAERSDNGNNPWLGTGASWGWGGAPAFLEPTGGAQPSGGVSADGGRPSKGSLPPRRVDAELLLDSYEETTGAAKYLGVTHTGGGAALVGDCVIEVYSNGNADKPYRRIPVPALGAGTSVELCTKESGRADCLPAITASPFNGNDALLVWCGGRLVDSFGQLGVDPGPAWSGGGVSSKDQRLLRCSLAADREPRDPFAIQANWVTQRVGESPETTRSRCPRASGEGGAAGL